MYFRIFTIIGYNFLLEDETCLVLGMTLLRTILRLAVNLINKTLGSLEWKLRLSG